MMKPRLSREKKKVLSKAVGYALFVSILAGSSLTLIQGVRHASVLRGFLSSSAVIALAWSALFSVLGYLFVTGTMLDLMFDDEEEEASVPEKEPRPAAAPVAGPPAASPARPASPPPAQPRPASPPPAQPRPASSPPAQPPPSEPRPPLPATGLPPMATPPPMALPAMNTPMPGELPKNAPEAVAEDDDEYGTDNEFSEGAPPGPSAPTKTELPDDASDKRRESGPFSGMGGSGIGGAGQE